MYMQNIIALGMISLFTWGCGNSDKQKGETVQTPLEDKVWYSNPVIDSDNPDPTVIKAEDGYFYLYSTGGNTWIHKSKDLVHWTYVSGAYEEDKKPSWEPDAGIWAPDINYIDGKYVMYYSLSKWGGGETCGIGFPFRIDRKDRLLTKVSYSGAMRLACTTVSTLSISRITARSTCFGEAGMVFGELS